MDLYAILRRSGWGSPAELEEAAARSSAEGDSRDDVQWIRSYVLDEGDGKVGTVCIYQAASEDAIRDHANNADLPVSEVVKIADTVIVREDPAQQTA